MELKMGLTPADFAIPRLEIGSKYNLPLSRLKNNLEMCLKDQATIHRVSSIFVNLVFEPIDFEFGRPGGSGGRVESKAR